MSEYIPSQEAIKRVLKNENSEEYDVGYYMGVQSMKYHEWAKDILWEYTDKHDYEEIQKKLEGLEE